MLVIRPRREWIVGELRSLRTWLAEAFLPVLLSALLVRSLSCAMSGERGGDSSRETRSATGACGDGASDGALGFQNRLRGVAGNPEAATSPSLAQMPQQRSPVAVARAGRFLFPLMRAWLEQSHGRHHKASLQPCALTTNVDYYCYA